MCFKRDVIMSKPQADHDHATRVHLQGTDKSSLTTKHDSYHTDNYCNSPHVKEKNPVNPFDPFEITLTMAYIPVPVHTISVTGQLP